MTNSLPCGPCGHHCKAPRGSMESRGAVIYCSLGACGASRAKNVLIVPDVPVVLVFGQDLTITELVVNVSVEHNAPGNNRCQLNLDNRYLRL